MVNAAPHNKMTPCYVIIFMRHFSLSAILPLAAFLTALFSPVMHSCITDDITTSPADQPEFSTDTLDMGYMFTGTDNPTFSFRVYNRHDKVLNISSIRMKSAGSPFRLNVDGLAGQQFGDIEIRPNDSIYVFVAASLPVNGNFEPSWFTDAVEFVTNGRTSEVIVKAQGSDVERLHGQIITADTRWSADRPRQVFDSLVVAPGATLTVEAGARICFHDGAYMRVRGSLVTDGQPGNPVRFTGDRTGNVVTDIPFELMSRQWQGMYIAPTARDCRLSYTEIINTWTGVSVDSSEVTGSPVLTLSNCRLRNSAGHVLEASHTAVEAYASEFAEAGAGPVRLTGGTHRFIGCTFSNYYLFSAITGPLVSLSHISADSSTGSSAPLMKASFINCILYGSGGDMAPTDLKGSQVTVERCLLRSNGSDDDNFLHCIWDTDPMFYTVRADYIFDYRLHGDSPAIGQALDGYSDLMGAQDFYGAPRGSASLGAYEPKAGDDSGE